MSGARPPEPVVLSWSGGKDSALALARLRADPAVRVAGLLTTVTAAYDRISIHGVRRALLHDQADALALPLHEATIEPNSTNHEYERAMGDALARLREPLPDLRRLAFGDLFLADVRRYREELVAACGFGALFPLWGEPTDAVAHEVIDSGFAARLVCVDTGALAMEIAGRSFDHGLLGDLPAGVDPCGERGEFHTFVSDGPGFRRPVPYEVGETVLRDGRFAYCDLVPIRSPDPSTPASPVDAETPP